MTTTTEAPTDTDRIRVTEISAQNVYGLRELVFDPDGVTRVIGDNDTGKTSVLKAIGLILGGGHDPDALHKDAQKGEVAMSFDNGVTVRATLTEKDTYYKIEGAAEGVTARSFINELYDEISVNPIAILQARPKDRGQILLEALPMEIHRSALDQALRPIEGGLRANIDYPPNFDQHALKVLGDPNSGLIGELFGTRREIHGARRDKKGSIEEMKETLDEHGDPEELKEERRKWRKQANAQREQMQEDLSDNRDQKDARIEEVDSWEEREIEKIREEAREKRDAVREEHEAEAKAIREEHTPAIETAEKKVERLDEQVSRAEEMQNLAELIEKQEAEHEQLDRKHAKLTEAIENLRDLRTDFAEDLPEGVRLDEDGEIVNEEGIRFEHWNEQSQVHFAARLAERRMGKLGLIPIDGIEKLVGDQRQAFLEWASQSDAQFIVTEAVAGEELTVEHVNGTES